MTHNYLKGQHTEAGFRINVKAFGDQTYTPVLVQNFVYECFNGPIPKDMRVTHIDKNDNNNALSNLKLIPSQKDIQPINLKLTPKKVYSKPNTPRKIVTKKTNLSYLNTHEPINKSKPIRKTNDNLKQLSNSYLSDAKKIGYTWMDLVKKATRQKVINEIQKYKNDKTLNRTLNEFNFDDTIFETRSNDQPLFKITEIGNTANKKFNAYTN
ncbi:hypothetical protein ACROYT_G024769, partial [Oculina patagonica]